MMRLLVTSALAAGLVVLGCGGSMPNKSTGMGETGGEGGDATGGSGTGGKGTGGSAQTGGSNGSTGGAPGTGGAATGGSPGTGGSGEVTPDASSPDAPGADAMSMMSVEAGSGSALGGEPFPGKPWIHLCPKAWNQTQCCELLCQCLPALCSDSPQDAPRFAGCMSMCTKLTDMRARCQVYHCFESKNPGAVKDHASHCGHASGRVGGGSCTILGQQQ
jgi:hypothetical protein